MLFALSLMTELKIIRSNLTVVFLSFFISGIIIGILSYLFRTYIFIPVENKFLMKIIFAAIMLLFAFVSNIQGRLRRKKMRELITINEKKDLINASYFWQLASLLLAWLASFSFMILIILFY